MIKPVYVCDECGDEFEAMPGQSFDEAWQDARDQGWIECKDEKDGELKHKCEECRR